MPILIQQFSIAMPSLYFTATENELGNIDLFGSVDGLANGTTVNLLFTDDFGNSKTATALVMDGEFSALNIWSGMFGAGNVNIMASAGGVQTTGDVELSGHHMQAPVMLTSQVLDQNMMIDVQGTAPGLMPGTVLTLVIRDEQNIDVTATALVLANGSFSVQDIDPQGLSEGTLAFDVVAEDANGALNLTNIASLIYTTPGPQGADKTLHATEDSAYVVIASAFGYNGTQGRTLTGVKITQLPANGMLKLNGAALQTDEVIVVQNTVPVSAGTSAYSSNGSDWTTSPFNTDVKWTSVLYINASNILRFTPAADANGAEIGLINFLAVDASFPNTDNPTAGSRMVSITRLSDNGGMVGNNAQDTGVFEFSSTVTVASANNSKATVDITSIEDADSSSSDTGQSNADFVTRDGSLTCKGTVTNFKNIPDDKVLLELVSATNAVLDLNGDGVQTTVLENGTLFDMDANGNGVTDAGELKTLQELNIVSFQLQAEVSDVQQNGNALGLISSYTTGDGQTHDLVDVWLTVEAEDVVVAPQNVVMGLASLGALFSDVTPALSFSAVENQFGNINIMGSAVGMANGTAVNLLLTDALGNSTTATATVMAEEFSVDNVWAGMFGAGIVSISAMAGGVQASEYLPLERDTTSMPIGLTSFALDENLRIDVQGFASSLQSGTVLTLVIRDVLDTNVVATAVVQADGAFSVQNIDTQGLSEGVLTLDVIAEDDNALLNLTNIASVVLTGSAPQGSDAALNATEDVAFVLSAANFGYASTQGHALTGVKITALPADGTLKLNGVTVQTDDVISKADLDAGKLKYQGALNGNGSNYASIQFKVQDSRAINNEDTTANTLTFNLAAVNDAPVLALAISDQVGMKGSAFNYTVPANAFVDVDSTLTYSATMADGSALPSWLSFNAATRTFSGTPSAIGNVNLLVKASDGSTTLSDAFVLSVGDSSGSGINLSTISAGVGGFVIDGGWHSAYSGFAISGAGDVNGDGLDDMIVSAYGSSGMANPVTYVVFGKSNLSPVKLNALGTQGFEIRQEQTSDKLGQSVSAAGDVNGDGLADLLVSANEFDPASSRFDAGRSYVVFGKASTTAVQLANVSAGIGGYAINGHTSLDFSGRWLSSAGDVNGDGLADFIVGAYKADAGSVLDVGRSYVVYGKTASNTAIELSALGTGGLVINGTVASDYSGWSVSAAGDVNGDGYADVIVGAHQADPNGTSSGRSYVVFGKPGGGSIDLANVNNGVGGFAIQGERTGDLSGYSVSSAGDVNGDGLADVIVGSPEGDSSGLFGDGRSFVVFGKTSGTAVQLTNISNGVGGFAIGGIFSNTDIGYSVSSAGDINGDGLADLLVGAPEMTLSTSEGYRTGQTYVVYGKANGSAVTVSTGMASSLGFAISGEGYQDLTGRIVSAAGDVNGDGLADLMISANTRNVDGYPLAGRTYVILGSTGGAFKTAVDLMGTTGDDTLTSTGTQTLMAGAGHDTLVANGADVLHGGSGNDVFLLGASTITALANGLGAGGNTGQLARVVGGTGFDTIRLTGGAHLDLTQVSNNAAGSQVDGTTGSRIDSIERIELGTDTAANTLTLSAKDVREMSGFNAIRTNTVSADGNVWTNVTGTALSDTTRYHQLVVNGTTNDMVVFSPDTGFWANAGTVSNGVSSYIVYQNTANFTQVLVNANMLVTNNDPAPFNGGNVNVNGVTLSLDYQWVQNDKTYFAVKNFSGTGDSNNNTMYTTHTLLDSLFNGGTDTVDTTVTAGVDDARTFLSGGYTFVLPTQAELVALSNTIPTTGWYNARYWSSTLSSANNHTSVGIAGDWVYTSADSTPEMLVLQVLPVVIDLNRDGILSYGQVTMDVNGDGHLDTTKWAGAQDGVLVWDKYADGLVRDNSQYAFAQYGGQTSADSKSEPLLAKDSAAGAASHTDLDGLRAGFDSNHDGVFDAQDAKFAEFKVWQDADQDGVSDAGEVRSLVDWGISNINLVSDGVVRAPAKGVVEAGQTLAMAADGTSVLVADAAFAYSAMDYRIGGGAAEFAGQPDEPSLVECCVAARRNKPCGSERIGGQYPSDQLAGCAVGQCFGQLAGDGQRR